MKQKILLIAVVAAVSITISQATSSKTTNCDLSVGTDKNLQILFGGITQPIHLGGYDLQSETFQLYPETSEFYAGSTSHPSVISADFYFKKVVKGSIRTKENEASLCKKGITLIFENDKLKIEPLIYSKFKCLTQTTATNLLSLWFIQSQEIKRSLPWKKNQSLMDIGKGFGNGFSITGYLSLLVKFYSF